MQLVQVEDATEANYIMFTETMESLRNKKAQSLTEELIGLTMNKLYPLYKHSSYLGDEYHIIDSKGRERSGDDMYLSHAYYQ